MAVIHIFWPAVNPWRSWQVVVQVFDWKGFFCCNRGFPELRRAKQKKICGCRGECGSQASPARIAHGLQAEAQIQAQIQAQTEAQATAATGPTIHHLNSQAQS